MPTGNNKTLAKGSHGNRVRVQLDTIQYGPSEDPEKIDWKQAFQSLSYIISRQMMTSDVLYLIGSALMDREGRDVALVYAKYVSAHRDKFTHDFMG